MTHTVIKIIDLKIINALVSLQLSIIQLSFCNEPNERFINKVKSYRFINVAIPDNAKETLKFEGKSEM